MPAGVEVTRPTPVPLIATLRRWVGMAVKAADTCASLESRSVQVAPLQAPEKPAKEKPGNGVAVSVTSASEAKAAEQTRGQSIPPGAEITLPLPVCCTERVAALCTKVAVTWASAATTIEHSVPLHAPLNPVNVQPGAAAAVSVTCVPSTNAAAQLCTHSMPAGPLRTEPEPRTATRSLCRVAGGWGKRRAARKGPPGPPPPTPKPP